MKRGTGRSWGPIAALRGEPSPFQAPAVAPWTPHYRRVVRRRVWTALAVALLLLAWLAIEPLRFLPSLAVYEVMSETPVAP